MRNEDKIKVLFIDDRQIEFDKLDQVFKAEEIFTLVNTAPIFDEGESKVLLRNDQKQEIINLIKSII